MKLANFTDTYIKNLKPQTKRMEKFEGGGFGILVYPTGSKSWIYRYKINNKKDYIIFGYYPEMSLSEARKFFHELYCIKRSGKNPKQVIEERKNQNTLNVESLMVFWYKNYVEKHYKQPLKIKRQIYTDIIPALGHLELDEIQTINITQSLDNIVNRGSRIHANRVLSTLKQAFNYAVNRGNASINPVANIKSRNIGGVEKPRERYLNLEEIKTIWCFLDNDTSKISLQTKNIIKIIILTGVRTAEARLARWSDINFEDSIWTIPAINTKSGITHKVHLTSLTKNIFQELKKINSDNLIIPGLIPNNPIEESTIPRAIKRIQDKVGIPHWTAHDLRRTFATQLGQIFNTDPVVIEKCLGHKMPRIMATYNKDEMLPQRKESLEKSSELIISTVGIFI